MFKEEESDNPVGSTEPAPSEDGRLARVARILLTGGKEGRHSAVRRT